MILMLFKGVQRVEFVVDDILSVIIVVAVHHNPGVPPRLKLAESWGRLNVLLNATSLLLCVTLLELVIGIL